jgi:dihydroxyacid dehydratase/phosphogluconate dehydratase
MKTAQMNRRRSTAASNPANLRAYSSVVVDGAERAASRAMLYAVGFTKEDFKKPQVGVVSTWSQVTPCNIHIDQLAVNVALGINGAGGKAMVFNTITISDGISMGSEGMKYSLVSREVIADSIETVAGCEGMDGLVAIGGCDKNMPGCLMALARLNRPAVFVYGGTILPGDYRGTPVDVVSVFEAVGRHAAGAMTDADLEEIESVAIPGAGSCGGMYTANTMASAIEALGMSLPNSSAQAAVSKDKENDCERAGAAVLNLLKLGIRPRDIMTRKAFENAVTLVITLGGSTNAVLHLLAMAHEAAHRRRQRRHARRCHGTREIDLVRERTHVGTNGNHRHRRPRFERAWQCKECEQDTDQVAFQRSNASGNRAMVDGDGRRRDARPVSVPSIKDERRAGGNRGRTAFAGARFSGSRALQ